MIDYMTLLQKDYVYCEVGFEEMFKKFDIDGNGTVDKQEMAIFIKNIITDQEGEEHHHHHDGNGGETGNIDENSF